MRVMRTVRERGGKREKKKEEIDFCTTGEGGANWEGDRFLRGVENSQGFRFSKKEKKRIVRGQPLDFEKGSERLPLCKLREPKGNWRGRRKGGKGGKNDSFDLLNGGKRESFDWKFRNAGTLGDLP